MWHFGVTVFQWNALYKEKTLNSQSSLKIIISRLDEDLLGLMSILWKEIYPDKINLDCWLNLAYFLEFRKYRKSEPAWNYL